MATRMYEVQQKIFAALESNSELQKEIHGIFDYVPEKSKFPYITFGPTQSSSERTKTDNGERITFNLDIWSESKGRKQTVRIITLIEKILEADLELETAFLIEQKVLTREVEEQSYGLFHGFIEFAIEIEWEDD